MERKIIYKYKSLNGNIKSKNSSFSLTKDSLLNHYHYFPNLLQLNDHFDGRMPLDFTIEGNEEYVEAYIEQVNNPFIKNIRDVKNAVANGSLVKEQEEIMNKQAKQVHILSLSMNGLNPIMWAFYANDFTGLTIGYTCFDFNEVDICLLPIDKTEAKGIVHNIGENYFLMIKKLDYGNTGLYTYNVFTNPNYLNKGFNEKSLNEDSFKNNLFMKTIEWEHEEEYRGLLLKLNSQKISYPMHAIATITFGFKADKKKISNIIKALYYNYPDYNFHNISFMTAIPDISSYKIITKPLIPEEYL